MAHNHHLRHRRHAKRQFLGGGDNDDDRNRDDNRDDNRQSSGDDDDEDSSFGRGSPATVEQVQRSTVRNIVFVTETPTFDEPIAGWTTIEPSPWIPVQTDFPDWEPVAEETPQVQQQPQPDFEEQPAFVAPKQPSTTSSKPTSAKTILPSYTSGGVPTAILVATTSTFMSLASPSSTDTTPATLAGATSQGESEGAEKSADKGISNGAKIGIIVGVLLLAVLAAGSVIWFYAKKKRDFENETEKMAEKSPFANTGGPMAGSKAAMRAPRLSLRPMTQFFGSGSGNGTASANDTKKLPSMAAAGAGRSLTAPTAGSSPWERRAAEDNPTNTSNPFKDPSNPFSDQNRSPSPVTPTISVTPPQVMPPYPTSNGPLSVRGPSPQGGVNGFTASGAADAVVAGAAAAGMAAKAGRGPPPVDVQRANGQPRAGPGSPESVKSGESVPASAIAGGPGANNVHRVQLDFKPSMDDEIELRAGQLIRILHEYDDGWALCIRLDRSQQGVAPRTCLSARPVKPRPANGGPPPNGPAGGPRGPPINGPNGPLRGPPGSGPNGRPMSPAFQQPRPMSPAFQQPRPMSPAVQQPRPMSPALHNGSRPASPAGQHGRPMSPAMRSGSRPSSPAGQQPRPMNGRPTTSRQPSPMGPGAFNQPPRPYSPGPRPGAPKRSMSPGPYGMSGGGPKPMTPLIQRRRSNSASVILNAAQNPAYGHDGVTGWGGQRPIQYSPAPTPGYPQPLVGQAISKE